MWERRLGHRERGGPRGEKAPPPRVQNGGPEWAVLGWGQGRCGRRRGGLRSIVGLFLHPTWNDREERQNEGGRQTRKPATHARTEEERVTQKTRRGGRPVVPALRNPREFQGSLSYTDPASASPPSLCAPGHAALTPGVPAQDEFANLIVDEDEETVGEGTEPPAGPAERKRRRGREGCPQA